MDPSDQVHRPCPLEYPPRIGDLEQEKRDKRHQAIAWRQAYQHKRAHALNNGQRIVIKRYRAMTITHPIQQLVQMSSMGEVDFLAAQQPAHEREECVEDEVEQEHRHNVEGQSPEIETGSDDSQRREGESQERAPDIAHEDSGRGKIEHKETGHAGDQAISA